MASPIMSGRPVHGCPIASREHAWIHGVPSRTCPCIGISFITAVEGHYPFCKVFGATLSALLVLYLFEDWVLLTLAIVFMMGLAWTSKSAMPRIWGEIMLLLNMGAVREGERLMYNGIPWLVQSLNFSAVLVNPELAGGSLRLPLHDLFALRSRSFAHEEPWFPTRTGDWVLLDDQTLGKVILQTPEIVRLILLGGGRRTFPTSDFLAQSSVV